MVVARAAAVGGGAEDVTADIDAAAGTRMVVIGRAAACGRAVDVRTVDSAVAVIVGTVRAGALDVATRASAEPGTAGAAVDAGGLHRRVAAGGAHETAGCAAVRGADGLGITRPSETIGVEAVGPTVAILVGLVGAGSLGWPALADAYAPGAYGAGEAGLGG